MTKSADSVRHAVILAGGSGRRMWPFATVRNKCAMPIANVPCITRLVKTLEGIGVGGISVVLGSLPGSVRHALRDRRVHFAEASSDAGTNGAAAAGLRMLQPDGPTLVLHGDILLHPDDLRALAATASEEAAALLWDEVDPTESGSWHHAELDGDHCMRIVGHETGKRQRAVGAVLLHPHQFSQLDANPGMMRTVPVGGMPPMEPDLFETLNLLDTVRAVQCRHQTVDLDKPWHIPQANRLAAGWETAALTQHEIHPTAKLHPGAEIEGFVKLGAGTEVGNRVVIRGSLTAGENTRIVNGAIVDGDCIVGSNSVVKDYCLLAPQTVVGNDCIVGHGAEMDGVMFDGSYLWHYCEISGVVGERVDIGAATVCGTLRFDDGPAEHRVLGRRERPRTDSCDAYFGDFSRTGVNVITMPGAKIGAYSCVGGGVVVYEDVPNNTLMVLKQEIVTRPWGPDRYGW
jgi:bifunctional UDP-N-acetylglucosamine pyrophosphorylase/glucosamine-1-phosphate N-acetyltransferase